MGLLDRVGSSITSFGSAVKGGLKATTKYTKAKKDPKVASFLEEQLFNVKGSAPVAERKQVWGGLKTGKMLKAFAGGNKQFKTAWGNVVDPNVPRDQVLKEWQGIEDKYDFFDPTMEKTFLSSISDPLKAEGFSKFNEHLYDQGYLQRDLDNFVQKNKNAVAGTKAGSADIAYLAGTNSAKQKKKRSI